MNMLKDIFGPIKAKELIEDVNEFIENVKLLGYAELKPWGEFLSAMKPPVQWDAKHLEQRITTNFLYYRTNYLFICAGVLLLRIVFSPFILFTLLLVAVLFAYVMFIMKKQLAFGEYIIDSQKKLLGCSLVSLLFLSLTGTLAVRHFTRVFVLYILLH